MNPNYKLFFNDEIKDEEISALRNSVGWDNNCAPFSKTKKISYLYLSIRYNSQLVGFIDVLSDGFNDAYIRDLMISKKHQRKGLGTELMKKTIKYLQEQNIKCIQITFDYELKDYYKKFGFHLFQAGIIDRDAPFS